MRKDTQKKLMLDKSGNMWIACYRNGLNQYIEKLMGFNTLELGDINTTTVVVVPKQTRKTTYENGIARRNERRIAPPAICVN